MSLTLHVNAAEQVAAAQPNPPAQTSSTQAPATDSKTANQTTGNQTAVQDNQDQPATTDQTDANQFNTEQTTAIEKIVHDYLVKNPQVLVEASEALQQQQEADMQKQVMGLIPKVAQDLFLNANSPVVGNKQGNVTLVEFFDYRCPHCKEMAAIIEGLIKKNPNLKVVLKEWPIFGGPSLFAAQAALAAQEQGKYWAFHNELMNAPQGLKNEDVLKLAKKAGLDVKKLQKAMQSDKIKQQIESTYKIAKQLQLQGTPVFIIARTPTAGADITEESLQAAFIPGATTAQTLQEKIDSLK